MSDQALIERYNYAVFKRENFEEWMQWDKSPTISSTGPDFPLWTLDEHETSLSALWSQQQYLVVEFGSFT